MQKLPEKPQRLPWSSFNTLGHSAVVRSSYVWAAIVPVVAKMLSAIQADFKILLPGLHLPVVLGVPFTWEILYYASIFFALASLVYSLCCPEIVKRYSTFPDFQAEGKGSDQLVAYAYGTTADRAHRSGRFRLSEDQLVEFLRSCCGGDLPSDPEMAAYEDKRRYLLALHPKLVGVNRPDRLDAAFWLIRGCADYHAERLRYGLAALYAVGFSLVSWVLVQNFFYVFNQHFLAGR